MAFSLRGIFGRRSSVEAKTESRATTPARKPDDGAAIALPSVRTYRIWTPAQIRQAEQSADSGNIRHAVDLCDWLLADDKVRGSLDGRVASFLSLPKTFEATGDKRRQGRVIKAIEADEDWDACLPNPESKQVLYWSLLLGMGPGVQRWQVLKDHGNRDIPVLAFYHPQPLRYDWPLRSWVRKLENGSEEPITFGDGVWFAHMPFGTYRPWSLGLWRALCRWVLLKQYAISDWGRAGETASRNVITSDKDVEQTFEKRQELASDISQMNRDSTLVLPPGFKYELVTASAVTKDLYKAQIEMADMAIAITVRGGNLSTGAKGGASLALGEVQERQGDLLNRAEDAAGWSVTTHDHTLVPWAQANYGDTGLAPYVAYQTEIPEDKKTSAEVFDTVMDAATKAQALGFELDRKLFADRFGFADFLKPGTVKDPPAPVAPGTPPAADPKKPKEKN
jgi:hypothetical protein